MIPIYQRFWHNTVTRLNTHEIMSVTNYLDTQNEYRVVLKIGVGDLIIKDGVIECYRKNGEPSLEPWIMQPALQGIKAYFGSGKQVKEVLEADQMLIDLLLENIMAVIQAETYFYEERGFPTAESYDDFWDQNYQGSCKYYSNLASVKTRFMEHIQPKQRATHLFSRFRNVVIYSLEPERWLINVNFSDSFHEMALNLSCRGQEYQVTEIEGSMLRCPDQVCQQAVSNLQEIVGMSLSGTKEKEILKITGGGQGCTHLGFMAVDAAKAVQAAMI